MAQPTDLMYSNEIIPGWSNTKAFSKTDLVCFSHLRWDFVHQRPQHLLSRAAKDRRVFYVEEPRFDDGSMRLDITERDSRVKVVVPFLPSGLQSPIATEAALQQMIDQLLVAETISEFVAWYYTPMALEYTRHLRPLSIVYDCMDELTAFKDAPADLKRLEAELFSKADLVFTGGQSLYESKKAFHHSVHAFPSSIDRDHFAQARKPNPVNEPADQRDIPHPRLGFFGVIDERFDVALLREVATAKPEWNFVIIGPVVKIDPEVLPQLSNIHYIGAKAYRDLPAYIAGWDVALLLFARNESTRFISPTKTPEYLAAGKPVISTSIRDVVRPYGENNLVAIADTREEFITAVERALNGVTDDWLSRVDEHLSANSWDLTWKRMTRLVDEVTGIYKRKPLIKAQPEALKKKVMAKDHIAGAA